MDNRNNMPRGEQVDLTDGGMIEGIVSDAEKNLFGRSMGAEDGGERRRTRAERHMGERALEAYNVMDNEIGDGEMRAGEIQKENDEAEELEQRKSEMDFSLSTLDDRLDQLILQAEAERAKAQQLRISEAERAGAMEAQTRLSVKRKAQGAGAERD